MRTLITLLLSLMAVACAPRGAPDAVPQGRAVQGLDIAAIERQVHEQVNAVRRRHGLRELAWNDTIHPVALGHSRTMRDRDRFAHVIGREDVIDRYTRGGFVCRVPVGGNRYLTGGENLFLGHRVQQWRQWSDGRREPVVVNDEAGLARRTVTGWMNSPPHRANMLQPAWRTEAIGVAVGADGRVWVTQNFC